MILRPKKVDSKAKGMTKTTAKLARKLDKKRYSTSDTNNAPSTKFLNTVDSVLSISQVRS